MESKVLTYFRLLYSLLKEDIDKQYVERHFTTLLFMSQLSYFSKSFVEKTCYDLGAYDVKFYSIGSTQAFFAQYETFDVVAFRGTEICDRKDMKTILDFFPMTYLDHRIHKGFVSALELVKDEMLKDISERKDPTKPLVYTGHSLGGALAVLFSVLCKPVEVTTFGSPRIFHKKVDMKLFEGTKYNKLLTRHDLVQYLPFSLFGFRQVGERIKLPSKFDLFDPLRPHKISTYLEALISADVEVW